MKNEAKQIGQVLTTTTSIFTFILIILLSISVRNLYKENISLKTQIEFTTSLYEKRLKEYSQSEKVLLTKGKYIYILDECNSHIQYKGRCIKISKDWVNSNMKLIDAEIKIKELEDEVEKLSGE
jgi:hypothetical protein